LTVILWDIMDTLVRDPFFTHVPGFLGLSFEELLHKKHPSAWLEFELGAIDEASLFQRFMRDGSPIDGPGLKRCMRNAYAFVDGVEPLLAELKARGVEMHALSNYPTWYQLIDERLQLSRYLELSFISCKTGLRKPAARAYLGACEALDRAPSECVFIDDREPNTRAAQALGMLGVHFTGDVGALRAVLMARGLLPQR
jgi:FMN hydrolase / 5-amino-6-(5-phospho-D-ribitylamino)uracil phosphatase